MVKGRIADPFDRAGVYALSASEVFSPPPLNPITTSSLTGCGKLFNIIQWMARLW